MQAALNFLSNLNLSEVVEMPIISVTTTATDVLFGGADLDSLSFKNGSATGTLYLRNKQVKQNVVSSSDYEWSLGAGGSVGFTRSADGVGIIGPWAAVGSATITLEILPIYHSGTRGR
mgnify:CR=1 FL=1